MILSCNSLGTFLCCQERKKLEAHFKKICGSSYDKEFEGFICRDSFGKLISDEKKRTKIERFW